jgi:ribosomal protein L11 methyltransferase
MSTYCLSFTIGEHERDRALAAAYARGTLGCREEENPAAVTMHCYFKTVTDAQAAEYSLMNMQVKGPLKITAIEDRDWNAQWRAAMSPARLSDSIWVSPLWLRPPMKSGDTWIVIEPKMAFGTGHHESTRLAAWGILSLTRGMCRNRMALDIGAGSGILCFVVNSCFAGACIGLDNDPVCAGNLAENRAANAQRGKSLFAIGTIDALKIRGKFDIVSMNMIMTQSEPLLHRVYEVLTFGGNCVWSGILVSERDSALSSARNAGFVLQHENSENEWWACVLSKPAS